MTSHRGDVQQAHRGGARRRDRGVGGVEQEHLDAVDQRVRREQAGDLADDVVAGLLGDALDRGDDGVADEQHDDDRGHRQAAPHGQRRDHRREPGQAGGEQDRPDQGAEEPPGLLARGQVGEQAADVHEQQRCADEHEGRRGQRGDPHQDVDRAPHRPGQVERDRPEPQVAGQQGRRLGGDEDRDQQLRGDRVRRVGDDLLVEVEQVAGLDQHPGQDERGQQHHREQHHRQHLRAAGPAQAVGVAQAGEEERPGHRALAEPRSRVRAGSRGRG